LPAQRLADDPGAVAIRVPKYAVVGTYSQPRKSSFVQHVAILADDADLRWGASATVSHMGPPLVAGEETKKARHAKPECVVHLAGTAQLSLDEQDAIRDWLEEVDKEPGPDNPFRRYIVNPHWEWHRARETGRRLYRRFSCAGFVLECFKSIELDLVDTQEGSLPDVDFDVVAEAYPVARARRHLERLTRGPTPDDPGLKLEDWGIAGDGPWPVLLPGYIFHALERIGEDNPRPPARAPSSVADACFPCAGAAD